MNIMGLLRLVLERMEPLPLTLRTSLLHAELVDEGASVGWDVIFGFLGPLGESLESSVQARFVTV